MYKFFKSVVSFSFEGITGFLKLFVCLYCTLQSYVLMQNSAQCAYVKGESKVNFLP